LRLGTFILNNEERLGALVGEYLVDISRAHARVNPTAPPLPGAMLPFLQAGEGAWRAAQNLLKRLEEVPNRAALERMAGSEAIYDPESVRLLAPVPNPSKVIAIGLNYWDHCREQKLEPPDRPIIFAKYPTAVIGPGEPIVWDPALTQQVDYEAELAFVVGKRARKVKREEAYDYIFGYMPGNDVSARDLQFSDKQWVRGKSLDTFCPLGPYLVSRDEVPDPHNLPIRCYVNGRPLQDSSTSEMIFDIPTLLSFITAAFTLLPGDVVLTGTPDGVGVFRKPQIFLKPGDRVVVEIEGLGRLENPVG
jgi:2-keto-4-pentenoate hydratase/2-oxohepta-3-ene-1,7-dioic acid hydratase in catechol pathway